MPAKVEKKGGDLLLLDGKEGEGEVGSMRNGMGWDGMGWRYSFRFFHPFLSFPGRFFLKRKTSVFHHTCARTDVRTAFSDT